jgi:hypothetical protein
MGVGVSLAGAEFAAWRAGSLLWHRENAISGCVLRWQLAQRDAAVRLTT